MKPELRALGFVAFCTLLAATSCTKKDPAKPVATTEPAPSASAAPKASAAFDDDLAEAGVAIGAWTDPPVVAQLAEDCGFDPMKVPEQRREEVFGSPYVPTSLMCGGDVDQSCVYDPCFEGVESDCKSSCKKTCSSCDAKCTNDCFACKAQCQDDACRRACAPTCAACKQGCLTTEDSCRTGQCADAYRKCRVKLSHDWKANGCAATCATYTPCRDACFERSEATPGFDSHACTEKCKAKLKSPCDLDLCGGKWSMSGGVE